MEPYVKERLEKYGFIMTETILQNIEKSIF